jgi:hypothetical protein
MSGELKELVVKILGDNTDAERKIKQTGDDTQKMGKQAEASGGGFVSAAKSVLGFVGAGLAIAGVTVGVQSLVGGIIDTVKAAAESESVMAQTNAVLQSTKGISGQTAQSISDLATRLMDLSGADDEAIQGAENMLATFTQIRSAAFEPATKAVLNMATSMNGGAIPSAEQLRQTAIQVGKALNDPVAGVTALQKVGVKLTDTQKKQIETLMKHNDVLGAQKIILGELNTEFGGAAEAAGGTFAGKLAILQGKLGNVQETIGGALLPVLTKMLDKIMPIVDTLANNLPTAIAATIAAFTTLRSWIDFLITNGDMVKTVLLGLGLGIAAVTAPILVGLVPAFIAWAGVAGAAALATIVAAAPIIAIIAGITLLVIGIKLLIQHWSEVSTFLTGVWAAAVAGVQIGLSTVGQFFSDLGTQVSGFTTGVAQGAIDKFNEWKGVIAGVAGVLALIFGPSLIGAGAAAVTAGAQIAASFIASLATAGAQAVVAGAQVAASFVASMATAGAQAVVNGAKVVASFVASLITTGVQAVITAGQMLGTLIPAVIAQAVAMATAAAGGIAAAITGLIAYAAAGWAAAAATIAATWPILLIIAAIALLIAGIILLVTHWTEVSNFLSGVWNAVVKAAQVGIQVLGQWFSNLGTTIHDALMNALANAVSFVLNLIARFQSAKDQANSIIGNMVSSIVSSILSLPGRAAAGLSGLVSMATGKINDFVGLFRGGLDKVVGFFRSLHIPIPHIPLPHFSIGGSFSINPPSVPHLNVDWYAKGGIFMSPQVVGVGDVPEAVIPLNRLGSVAPSSGSGSSASGGEARFDLDGRTIVRGFMPYILDELRRAGAIKDY